MCCKRVYKKLAVAELHTGLVFEPQGPLVESVLTVNIAFFSIFKKNKKVAN